MEKLNWLKGKSYAGGLLSIINIRQKGDIKWDESYWKSMIQSLGAF